MLFGCLKNQGTKVPIMEPKKRRNDWVVWVAAGIALPVLYVLSTGPVYWAMYHGWCPNALYDPLMGLYRPLDWACGDEGELLELLWWYRWLCAPPSPTGPGFF